MNNLIYNDDYNKVADNLKKQMWEKMSKIGDNFEKNSYYQENWVEDRIIKRTATV
jgi:uncharacterized protein YpbB